MNRLSNLVIEHDGVLVDYAGDELFAMWARPESVSTTPNGPATPPWKCSASSTNSTTNGTTVGFKTDFGIGVNSGTALVGNIGTDRKLEYVTTRKHRQSGKSRPGRHQIPTHPLLITGETRRRLSPGWDAGRLRRICQVKVQNIVAQFELYQLASQTGPDWEVLRTLYEKAIHAFEIGDLAASDLAMGELFQHFPNDGPVLLNLRVAEAMLAAKSPSTSSGPCRASEVGCKGHRASSTSTVA